MKVVSLAPKALSTKDMLEVLDALRADVESGEVVAFAGVSIDAKDACSSWAATGVSVTRLRVQGAIAQLLHSFIEGEVG